jgi:hypothetical protein
VGTACGSLRKVLEHGQHRIGRGLAEAADGGVCHHLGQVGEQVGVPVAGAHELHGLLRAVAAGRALAAALVLEEAHQVQRHGLHVVLVGQDDDGVAADEGAMLLELPEVERDIGHVRRQDAAGGAARQVALEVVAVGHVAAQLDQLPAGRASRGQHHAGFLHAPRDRIGAQALGAVLAL